MCDDKVYALPNNEGVKFMRYETHEGIRFRRIRIEWENPRSIEEVRRLNRIMVCIRFTAPILALDPTLYFILEESEVENKQIPLGNGSVTTSLLRNTVTYDPQEHR